MDTTERLALLNFIKGLRVKRKRWQLDALKFIRESEIKQEGMEAK